MNVDDTKWVAEQAFHALAAEDLAALDTLLAPNAVIHQCGFLQPISIRALLRGRFEGGLRDRGRVIDRTVQLEQVIAEGDTAALRWRTTGRYADADSPRLDGTAVQFPSMSFVRVEDGKIAEIWNMRDADTLRSELEQAAAD